MSTGEERTRPAFYALAPGSWRDYVSLLHPPYTLWHLSYVVIGAALASQMAVDRLAITLGAFFLGVGVAAHALDELNGRPLQTEIPTRRLVWIAVAALAGAIALGVYGAIAYTLWLAPLVALGGFVVAAYNLEWLGGRFHTDAWFAATWGALPVVAAYLAQTGRVRAATLLAAGFAFFLSAAQRRLSTEVRLIRRRVRSLAGRLELDDGTAEEIRPEMLLRAPEASLRLLLVAVVALAAALVALHA